MHFWLSHIRHHARFYIAVVLGVAAYVLGSEFETPLRLAGAGDTFFAVYLVPSWWLMPRLTPADLDRRAPEEDEGILIVLLIALAAMIFSSVAIFLALNQKHIGVWALVIAFAGAPLSWLMLQTLWTFHYANLFYRGGADAKDVQPLRFPGTPCPGPWEFFYFAIVIGMTTQVSDVEVQCSSLRRAVSAHGIVSFFFNTVLIAMAVNAVVAAA